MTATPADGAVRSRALDPSRSFIVQAPAGSGKTELLTRRYLALLATVERPEEVLAITFTRKAAAEMRKRVLDALGGRARGEEAGELAARARARSVELGWEVQENPARLRILTIDGFNGYLASRLPILSGAGGASRVTEDAEELHRRAAELALGHLEEEDGYADALAEVLVHLDNRAEKLAGYLARLLARRDQWLRRRPASGDARLRPAMEEELRRILDLRLAAVEEPLRPYLPEMAALAAYAGRNLPEGSGAPVFALDGPPPPVGRDAPHWRALASCFLTSKGELRTRVDRRSGFPADGDKAVNGRMTRLLRELAGVPGAGDALAKGASLPDPAYGEEEWRIVAPLLAVADLALASLMAAQAERGECDFAEIALRALRALGCEGDPSELTLALDRRISHILVDEFQDTSRSQFDLLERLTEGWSEGDGRTLFLVGDPMQSIYRFREADVALFGRARETGVGPVRVEKLSLTVNFRSRESLVDYHNFLFPRIFPARDDATGGAVAYSPSAPAQAEERVERARFVAFGENDREGEADAVADEVERALREGPGATVGVLVRARTHATHIVAKFKERGIPFRGEKLDPLSESLPVIDVLSLARALADPTDRLSWLALLRAPWCGLTLEETHRIAGGCADQVAVLVRDAVAHNRLEGDSGVRLARLWSAVEPALGRVGREEFATLVEGVWTLLGAPACLDARGMEDARAALRLLASHSPGATPDLAGLESKLAGLYSAPDPEGGAVTVMTIHNAKGLQFDAVIVPGLGRRPRGDERELIAWEEGPGGGLVLGVAPPVRVGAQGGIIDFLRLLEKERERNERIRLVYVAATRAVKSLLLLGHAKLSKGGKSRRPASGSLLEVLWPAVAEHFTSLASMEGVPGKAAKSPEVEVEYLPGSWAPPRIDDPPIARPRAQTLPEEEEQLFDWAREERKHIGTVTHALLELFGREGVEKWTRERVEGRLGAVRARLAGLGVAREHLEECAAQVVEAACAVLEDPEGRALFVGGREARSEYAVTTMADGEPVTRRIDRTFIDVGGVRWIIDFKTTTHEGGSLEEFLAGQSARHREQLAGYARLFRLMEPEREVRAALYYPLLRRKVEVEV